MQHAALQERQVLAERLTASASPEQQAHPELQQAEVGVGGDGVAVALGHVAAG